MVTIKELAELANVSRGTVDRVLNHRGAVSPETAKKVLEIARTLGYKPNRAGMALAAQKKKLRLGVILFGPENPFFQRVLEGVLAKAEELSAYDCTVLIRRVIFDAAAQIQAIDELVLAGIHGLVMTPYNDPLIREKINQLSDQGIPVITTNTDIQGSKRLAYVGSDYRQGGRTAGGLMRLVTGGHAKLGIITGSSQVLCHTERIAGFLEVLEQTAPDIHVLDILKNHDDEFESYEVTKRFLENHPEADAIFFVAAGVHGGCRAIQNMNRSKNLQVICFDAEDTIRQMVMDGLISASISQQPCKQGSRPLDMLFEYLTTGEPPEREINYVEASIKIRENL